jgi:DeoR/GlpR family transcriptional regulator of sugar metabolism
MQAEERHAVILEVLLATGRVEIGELRERLGVSEMTVRRDLAALEAEGALRRVYGGASRILSGSYEPPFSVRSRLNQPAKQAIAHAVGQLVSDGETVIVDGGSTGVALAEMLTTRVVTACPLSLRVTMTLATSNTVRLLLPGGFVRPGEQSFVGEPAMRALEHHVFDTYLMTVSGANPTSGLTEWNSDDAAVKRAALANAQRCIVACDSSKFTESAFTKVAQLSDVDVIVTDAAVTGDVQARLREAKVDLVIASPSPTPQPSSPAPDSKG